MKEVIDSQKAKKILTACKENFGDLTLPLINQRKKDIKLIYFDDLFIEESLKSFLLIAKQDFDSKHVYITTSLGTPILEIDLDSFDFAPYSKVMNDESKYSDVGLSIVTEIFYFIPDNIEKWIMVGHRYFDYFILQTDVAIKSQKKIFADVSLKEIQEIIVSINKLAFPESYL